MDALAKALNVSLVELMSGDVVSNSNATNSMAKTKWYVCPACGNVIHAMGDAVISCCGITLPKLEEERPDENHNIKVERLYPESEALCHFKILGHGKILRHLCKVMDMVQRHLVQ